MSDDVVWSENLVQREETTRTEVRAQVDASLHFDKIVLDHSANYLDERIFHGNGGLS